MSENYKNYIWQAKFELKSNWLKAVDILTEATNLFPEEKELFVELADIFIVKEQFRKAIDILQKAYNIDNTDNMLLFKLANCYLSVNEPKLSIHYYNQISDIFPEALYNKAIALSRINRNKESIEALEEVLTYNPETDIPYMFLVEQLITLAEHQKALGYLQTMEDRFGETQRICFLKGVCLSAQNIWIKAYIEFQKAERMNLQSVVFYHAYGICCENIGKVEEGIQYLKRCLEMEPYNYAVYLDLIKIYLSHERLDDAFALADSAKNRDPKSPSLSMIYSKIMQLINEKK